MYYNGRCSTPLLPNQVRTPGLEPGWLSPQAPKTRPVVIISAHSHAFSYFAGRTAFIPVHFCVPRRTFEGHRPGSAARYRRDWQQPSETVAKVVQAPKAIIGAMNCVERHFGVGPTTYDMQFGAIYRADCLLTYVDEGLAAIESRASTHPPMESKFL